MAEAEADVFEEDIVVTAPRLGQNGGGGSDWYWQDWSNNWYSQIDFGNDAFAYLLGVDNIIFTDFTAEPETEPRPSVDEFIDTIQGFLASGFIGNYSATANYDAFGAPTDATLTLYNFDSSSLDVYFFSRDSEFFANVPRDANDFTPIPNERYNGPIWSDLPLA